jgi:putative acetyltransferase
MTTPLPEVIVRDVSDGDGLDLAALIGAVFAEYDGCVFVGDELPELSTPASAFAAQGGGMWVAQRFVRGLPVIVGCAGYGAAGEGIELKKLYVAARERKTGLGGRLLGRVEAVAYARGAKFIEMWSDTRFTTAHAFYERRGYKRGPTTRDLHDASASVEYYFRKVL